MLFWERGKQLTVVVVPGCYSPQRHRAVNTCAMCHPGALSPSQSKHAHCPRLGDHEQKELSPLCLSDHMWAGVLLNLTRILSVASVRWRLHGVSFKEMISSSALKV